VFAEIREERYVPAEARKWRHILEQLGVEPDHHCCSGDSGQATYVRPYLY
jgi:hypothetical protein